VIGLYSFFPIYSQIFTKSKKIRVVPDYKKGGGKNYMAIM